MNLSFDLSGLSGYRSKSQIARVMTENWVQTNMFCPRCGHRRLSHFQNNAPVADFLCENCGSQFELKGKNGALGKKVADGAYDSMIQRITGNDNPDFFFMSYSAAANRVNDFFIVPKYFFVPGIIEKRKPLAETARRAGWTGCNILFDQIPKQGKIAVVKNGEIIEAGKVVEAVGGTAPLETENIASRGWLMDTLNIVNSIQSEVFELKEVYAHVDELSKKHPENRHIKDKLRQQLQILRDKGMLEFLGNGTYKKAGVVQ